MTERRVTLRTIAEHARVDPSTVSRVLSGDQRARVGADTAKRIHAIADALGYEPDPLARGLRTRRTLALGVVIPRLTDVVLATMVEAAAEQARSYGYQAITMSTRDQDAEERSIVEMLLDRRVDGIILATAMLDDPVPEELKRRGVAFVLMNRRSGAHPSVSGDDDAGGYLATRHLLDEGHERIGVIAGPGHVSTASLRVQGYRRAHAEAGIAVDEVLVMPSSFSADGGQVAADQLLSQRDRPTAIFAVNDFAAIGAMAAIRDHGLTVPGDVAIVGYNDVPIAAKLPVSLSSVALPLEEMGGIAVEMLIDQLQGTKRASVILPPRLHIRESSRRR